MSDMSCPSIKIKSPHPEHNGHMIINESDFDSAKHTLHIEGPVASVVPPPPPPPPAPVDPLAGLAADWQTGDPAKLRDLAAAVSGRAVENAAQAVQVISAALAARG